MLKLWNSIAFLLPTFDDAALTVIAIISLVLFASVLKMGRQLESEREISESLRLELEAYKKQHALEASGKRDVAKQVHWCENEAEHNWWKFCVDKKTMGYHPLKYHSYFLHPDGYVFRKSTGLPSFGKSW